MFVEVLTPDNTLITAEDGNVKLLVDVVDSLIKLAVKIFENCEK